MRFIFDSYHIVHFSLKDIMHLIAFKNFDLNLDFTKKQNKDLYVFECEKLVS